MKLFSKEGRRYSEASDSQILQAAARVLMHRGLDDDSRYLLGMSKMVSANEADLLQRRALSEAEELKAAKEGK